MAQEKFISGRARAQQVVEAFLSTELETIRQQLIARVDDNQTSILQFMEAAILFWQQSLGTDRIFVCDMRSGQIVAGWNQGKDIARLQDWDPEYVPLDHDKVLQQALESDELVANPTAGVGVDLAFTLPLDTGDVWLVAVDQTDDARAFSRLDMAYITLVRDLVVIKSRLLPQPSGTT